LNVVPDLTISRPAVVTGEWRRGWILVLVSMIGLGISTSHIYTMGIFMGPVEKSLGWSRGQISSGLLVNSVVAVLFAPFFGLLIDRFGVRRVGLPGMVIYCSGIMLLSATGRSIWTWYGFWLIVAIGSLLIKPTLWATAIAKNFEKQRALALAVMLCGSGLGSSILPIVTTRLIAAYGWRGTYIALGSGALLLIFPLIFFFLRDEASTTQQQRTVARATLPGLEIRAAILSTQFLRIALSALIMTVAMAGLNVHFAPMIMARGVGANTAAAAAGCIGITSILGRLCTGVLLDRWNGPVIGAITFSLPLVAAALWLNYDGGVPSALIMAATVGFSLGAEIDIIAYLSTQYFGLKNYGTIFGTVVGVLVFGGGVGPTLAGIVYDRTHSYSFFVWCAIPAFLLAAVLIGSLGAYPGFRNARTAVN
jgi:MFS family permease